jgi:hypothetical protein
MAMNQVNVKSTLVGVKSEPLVTRMRPIEFAEFQIDNRYSHYRMLVNSMDFVVEAT